MRPSLRSRALLTLLLSLLCCSAMLAACGGSSAHSPGTTGSGTTTGTTGNGGGGMGGGVGFDAGPGTHTLTISPPMATITITNKTVPATQAFTAILDGSPVSGSVTW